MTQPTLQISCKFNTSDPTAPLGLEIRVDGQTVLNVDHVKEAQDFTHTMPDDEADHFLEFVMKNKTDKDTTIDSDGNIVRDARLIISDVAFDDICLGQIFIDRAEYTHNFNGTRPEVKETFYGEMGCNGIVRLDFTTPMYLWLLENM